MKLFNICIGKKLKDELIEICNDADYSLSEFTRQAIRTKIRAERAILSQCTNNQEIDCSGALNGSEGSNKLRDEVKDKMEENTQNK